MVYKMTSVLEFNSGINMKVEALVHSEMRKLERTKHGCFALFM